MQKKDLAREITMSAVWLLLVVRLAEVVLRVYYVLVLKGVVNGGTDGDTRNFMIKAFKVENIVVSFLFIAFFTAFSIWFYNLYKKVQEASGRSFSYKPIFALFSFIIPIFNLFAPYKIMGEIWAVVNRDPSQEETGRRLINQWWFIGIVLVIYLRFCNYSVGHAAGTAEFVKAEYFYIVFYLISIHYLLTVQKLITLITREQNYRY